METKIAQTVLLASNILVAIRKGRNNSGDYMETRVIARPSEKIVTILMKSLSNKYCTLPDRGVITSA